MRWTKLAAHSISARRLTTGLALTVLLTSTLTAQRVGDDGDGGPQEQAAQPSILGTATLHGTVLNALTRQPIAHALVSLDQYSSATLTDNEGRFAFTSLPAGETTLSARRPGYSGDEPNSGETRRTVSLSASAAEATLTLTPLASITGELLLPNDDAPDNMQVQLLRREVEEGRGQWSPFRNAEVTSDSRFRFGNLPPGDYLVHVGASLDPAPAQEPSNNPRPRAGYVPAFYPGVREIAAAGTVTLAPGQQADLRLPLTREPYYPVTLAVANATGMRNIGFNVTNDSFLGLPARYSPDDGLVHMDLPTGHYRLEGRSYGPDPLSGVREFDVNAAPTRAGALVLLPVNRIPVTVHDESSHPPPTPPDGRPLAAPDKLLLTLQPEAGSLAGRGSGGNLQQDHGGPQADHGILENVAPGRYWVNARAFSGYLASLVSGGVDLLTHPLVVGPDGSAAPIEATLRDDTASLSASLAPALQPASSAVRTPVYLQLVPQSGSGIEQTALFPADYTAQLSNLAPGTYLALATTSRRQIEYRNPQVLAGLAGKAQSVTVEPGGSAHLTLESLADAPGLSAGSAQ